MNRPLYGELVPYYEIFEGRDWEKETRLISLLLKKYGCHSVIDLGCGTGRHVRELATRGFEATGVDISKASIEYAKRVVNRKQNGVHFRTGSYYTYHTSRQFDAALSLNWSIPVKGEEIERFLLNTSRLIKPRGILIFDYEAMSEIDWDAVGTPIFTAWETGADTLVRVSLGNMTGATLGSRDVYLVFPRVTRMKQPSEIDRYQKARPSSEPKIYVDNSVVRFFTPAEIQAFASHAGFRRVLDRRLRRGKYTRVYQVLQKV